MREITSSLRESPIQNVLVIHAILGDAPRPARANKQRHSFMAAMILALAMTLGIFLSTHARHIELSQVHTMAAHRPGASDRNPARANTDTVRRAIVPKVSIGHLGYASKMGSGKHVIHAINPHRLQSIFRLQPIIVSGRSPLLKPVSPPDNARLTAVKPHYAEQKNFATQREPIATIFSSTTTTLQTSAGHKHRRVPFAHPRFAVLELSLTRVAPGYGTTLCIRGVHARSLYVSDVGSLRANQLSCRRLAPLRSTTYSIWLGGQSGEMLQRNVHVDVIGDEETVKAKELRWSQK